MCSCCSVHGVGFGEEDSSRSLTAWGRNTVFHPLGYGPWCVALRSHYMRPSTDFMAFAWGALETHCGLVRCFGSVACVKSREMLNFSGSDGSVGQSDRGYANTLQATTGSILQQQEGRSRKKWEAMIWLAAGCVYKDSSPTRQSRPRPAANGRR